MGTGTPVFIIRAIMDEKRLQFDAYCANMSLAEALDAMSYMKKREEYLSMHPYRIYQGSDGKWYTNLPDNTKDRGTRLLKRTTKSKLEDVVAAYWQANAEQPTLDNVFAEWNDRRLELKKVAPGTHLRDRQVYNRFYGEIGATRVSELTVDDFVDFLETQIPTHSLTAKAFSGLKRVTKGILKQARKDRLIDYTAEDVFAELDLSESSFNKIVKESREEVFDEDETDKVIAYLEQNPDLRNLAILLMFVTGLRVGEVVALKKEDFADNVVRVRRTETKRPRDDGYGSNYTVKDFPKSQAGVRDVILPNEYQWLAEKLSDTTNEYVFEENGYRFTTNAIRRRLTQVCQRTGVYHKSPHKIRKTYGSILLDNNLDQRLVISQMGHTSVSCTENHYHRNRRSLEQKSEIISGIQEFKKHGRTDKGM